MINHYIQITILSRAQITIKVYFGRHTTSKVFTNYAKTIK